MTFYKITPRSNNLMLTEKEVDRIKAFIEKRRAVTPKGYRL